MPRTVIKDIPKFCSRIIATFTPVSFSVSSTQLCLHLSDHMLGPPTIDNRAGAKFSLKNHMLVSASDIWCWTSSQVCVYWQNMWQLSASDLWSFTALNKIRNSYLVNGKYIHINYWFWKDNGNQSFLKYCWSLLALITVIQRSVIGCPLYGLFALKSLLGAKCHCAFCSPSQC